MGGFMKHAASTVTAGLLLTFAALGVAAAGEIYPDKPIRFVVPFPAGGSSDILARLVGKKLNESMGQPLVIDNRPSVGGVLAFELAKRAAPDGYTILLAPNAPTVINPSVYLKLSYDPQRDFQPVTQLTMGGNVMVVTLSVPAHSVKEFIAFAKSKPGQINFATTGTNNLLSTVQLNLMTGIEMVNIPYKGTPQAFVDLISGQVHFFLANTLVAIPHLKAGKLRGLAVTSLTRNPALPDLPTVDESGVPGYEAVTWHGIAVPAGTPMPIVKRLNTELVKIVNQPDVNSTLKQQGLTPVGSTPEQLGARIKTETEMYAKLVKQIGFKPQ